jgi:hypothetical protein
LEIAHRDTVGRRTPEGPQADGSDVEGLTESVELFLGFGIERWFVGRECYATVSVCLLIGNFEMHIERHGLCGFDGLNPNALVYAQ